MNQEFEAPSNPDNPNSAQQEKRFGFLLIAFLLGALVPGILCFWMPAKAKMVIQAEAVKTGHAVYRVVDEYGTTRFEWLPPHETASPAPEKK